MIGRPGGARQVAAVIVASGLLLAGCADQESSDPGTAATSPAASVSAVGSPSPIPTPTPSPTPSATPSPTPSPTPTPTPTPTPSSKVSTADRPVIVIDPGHSGRSIRSVDPSTGLVDFDYPNYPEIYEVFEVSTCVARDLRRIGYRVIMTKKKATSTVSLAARARIANTAHADLAISVHNDHSQSETFQAVYSQRGIKHDGRYHEMWRGSGADRTVYDHRRVARLSARYTRIIARERERVQDRPVQITEENFTGRSGLEPGNLALVQLLADVPWVYNEAGAKTGGSTTERMTVRGQTSYAKGILDGIVVAVPVEGPEPESTASMLQCIRQHRDE